MHATVTTKTRTRLSVDQIALWTTDAVELGRSLGAVAAGALSAPFDDVVVVDLERLERGWALTCADRTVALDVRGVNLITVLHHLAAGRMPPGFA